MTKKFDGNETGKAFCDFIDATYDDAEDRMVVALRSYMLMPEETEILMRLTMMEDKTKLKEITDKMVALGLPTPKRG